MQNHDLIRQQAQAALSALEVPARWTLKGFDSVPFDTDEPERGIQSIGAVFIDKAIKGQSPTIFRVFYHVPSERLGLVEKSIIDFKPIYKCIISNIGIKTMNEFIAEYTTPKTPEA